MAKFNIDVDPENGYMQIETVDEGMQVKIDEVNKQIKIFDGGKQQVVINKGSNVKVESGSSYVDVQEDSDVIVESSSGIYVGEGATEPAVLGNLWKSLFLGHTHMGNLGSPTSPPLQSVTNELSSKVYIGE